MQLGTLSLDLPRVVGTVTSPETLTTFPTQLDGACDLIEVRLDEITSKNPSFDWLRETERFEKSNVPVIGTIRLKKDGGQWEDQNEALRLEMLNLALHNLSTIDIEYDSCIRKELCHTSRELDKVIIISYHDFSGTPDIQTLSKIVEDSLAEPNSIVKIATYIKNDREIEILRQLVEKYKHERPICVIGMGSLGTKTRLEFPLSGTKLTYGYLDQHCAPGQLSARTLVNHLRSS